MEINGVLPMQECNSSGYKEIIQHRIQKLVKGGVNLTLDSEKRVCVHCAALNFGLSWNAGSSFR